MENEIKKLKKQIKKLREKKQIFRQALVAIQSGARGVLGMQFEDESGTHAHQELERILELTYEAGVVDWERIRQDEEDRERMFEEWDREEEEAEREYCYRRRVALARQRKLERDEYDEIPPTDLTLRLP